MNNFLKNEWRFLLLLIIPIIISVLVYPHLPEQVPIHWNIHGQVDNYGSKEFGAFFMPLLNIGMYILFIILPHLDPKKKNYQKFTSSYTFLRYVMHFFFLFMYCLTLAAAFGYSVDIGLWVGGAVAILFIALGNILSRVRHNYFVGFKLPWTLASEEVWRKTHLLGSKLMVAGGVFGLIGVLLTQSYIRFIVLMVGVFVPIIVTTIYSYVFFKKLNK